MLEVDQISRQVHSEAHACFLLSETWTSVLNISQQSNNILNIQFYVPLTGENSANQKV